MTPESARVLVVDDETGIRSVVRAAVESLGHAVFEAATTRHALELAKRERPDLIILDLGLRDGEGADVVVEVRRWSSVPVIVLTARHEDSEKVALLDAGADDYLTKPFSPSELQARVRAQLRRAAMGPLPGGDRPFERNGLHVDLAARRVSRDGAEIHLTPTEWALLRALLAHTGRTMTHHQLFNEVWGRSHGDAQQYLRVYVAHLRRKLERDPLRPRLILTEAGVGYRLDA